MRLNLNYYIEQNELEPTFKIMKHPGKELFTISYIHGGIDFSKKENRLARGLTLDHNNNVVLVGFEKFFNNLQLENYETYSEDFKEEFSRIQNKDKIVCYDKLDGSMVILGLYEDELIASTTSSICNSHAEKALELILKRNNVDEIKNHLKDRNSCLIFEMTGRLNPHVVSYNFDCDLILLGEVSKETLNEIEIVNNLGFKLAEKFEYSYEELLEIQKNSENIEGFVAINSYGHKVKFKTNWWFTKSETLSIMFASKISMKIISEIIKSIEEDTIDDLFAFQNSNEVWKRINMVGKVKTIFDDYIKSIEDFIKFSENNSMTIKDIANYKDVDSKVKSLAICKIKGYKIKQYPINEFKDKFIELYGSTLWDIYENEN